MINLVKSIEKTAEEESDDPFLVTMSECAQQVMDSYESRQDTTQKTFDQLLKLLEENEKRKKEQAEKGFDGLTYFVYCKLIDHEFEDPEAASLKIRQAFIDHPNWLKSENTYRELRESITYALFDVIEDLLIRQLKSVKKRHICTGKSPMQLRLFTRRFNRSSRGDD